MAKDARRFVRLTLTEDQAAWIETQFSLDPNASKADAIKTLIGRAMGSPAPAAPAAPVPGAPPAEPCAASGILDTLQTILATGELLTQKYMADHPEKKPTRDEEAAATARWISYKAKRKEFMASHAP